MRWDGAVAELLDVDIQGDSHLAAKLLLEEEGALCLERTAAGFHTRHDSVWLLTSAKLMTLIFSFSALLQGCGNTAGPYRLGCRAQVWRNKRLLAGAAVQGLPWEQPA